MRSRGFTLVEMLVVMAISAILIAAAVPSFQALIASTRASSASGTLLSNLEYARSEAIRRNQNVTVCRTTDANAPEAALACSDVAALGFDGNDWASGWIVFAKAGIGVNFSAFEFGEDFCWCDSRQRMLEQSVRPCGRRWRARSALLIGVMECLQA